MDNTKVRVRIYGQEYTISGERDEATIMAIAQYVDTQMREVAKFYNGNQPGAIATLTAVNICDEMYAKDAEIESLRQKTADIQAECDRYMQMWEEAKKSFTQYKERANDAKEEVGNAASKIKELEGKIAEFESAYFDLQVENMQLKNKLASYE